MEKYKKRSCTYYIYSHPDVAHENTTSYRRETPPQQAENRSPHMIGTIIYLRVSPLTVCFVSI
jgi:hypothetical protein